VPYSTGAGLIPNIPYKGSPIATCKAEVEAVTKKWIMTAMVTGLLAVASSTVGAAQSQTPAADNTKKNKNIGTTADQGKNNTSDRTIMQKIRQAVMADKSLSTYAHNVKIISQNGKVTLKGPVHSDAEKQSIEQKAVEVAGAGNVTNELTIKAAKPKKTSN
jgi:osmotically-inducible protein OsmY